MKEAMWSAVGPWTSRTFPRQLLIGPLQRIGPLAIYPTGQASAASNTFPIPAVRVPWQQDQRRQIAPNSHPALYHVQVPQRVAPELHSLVALGALDEQFWETSRFNGVTVGYFAIIGCQAQGNLQDLACTHVSRSTSNLRYPSSPAPSSSLSSFFSVSPRANSCLCAIPNDRSTV